MRIKAWEWIINILFVFYGFSMIRAGRYELYGIPMFPWVAYVLTVVGVAIPIMAWFLRTPSRNQKAE